MTYLSREGIISAVEHSDVGCVIAFLAPQNLVKLVFIRDVLSHHHRSVTVQRQTAMEHRNMLVLIVIKQMLKYAVADIFMRLF